MKQNVIKNLSNMEKFSGANLADNTQEKSFPSDATTQKNQELQQQARYLNRVLEAYGDCV